MMKQKIRLKPIDELMLSTLLMNIPCHFPLTGSSLRFLLPVRQGCSWTGQTVEPPDSLAFSFGKFSSVKSGFQPKTSQAKIQADRWFVGSSLYFSEGTDWMTFFFGSHLFVDEVHIPKQGRLSSWSTFLFFFFSVNEKLKAFHHGNLPVTPPLRMGTTVWNPRN